MVLDCRRPPKISKSSLLAERMPGSSVALANEPQQELVEHEQNDVVVRSEEADANQQLSSPPRAVPSSAGSGDAPATSRNVASACSIESAIDSVISQGRTEVKAVTDLPATLPPDLVECLNSIKDVVSYHLA